MFTWLAETTAGPATSGTVFNSATFFLAVAVVAFFVVVFLRVVVDLFGAVALGAFVGASTSGVTVGIAGIAGIEFVIGVGSGGGAWSTGAELDASCANTLVESAAAKTIQRFFFINLPK
jgi:hypothetical protein